MDLDHLKSGEYKLYEIELCKKAQMDYYSEEFTLLKNGCLL